MKREESTWRMLHSGPATGPENMALDEALLESVRQGNSPPTLRLYAWQPPALSLGYGQSIEEVDLFELERRGWDLVRRPTGGRAILHTDELTYAVIAPERHPLVAGGVLASYRRLSAGLQQGLINLGLEVHVSPELPSSEGREENPVCFEIPSSYEITVQGKKLVGSAQVRRRGGVLQHGTLPLRGDIGRICLALRFSSEADRQGALARVRSRAATVGQLLERRVTWQEAAAALAAGFEGALGFSLEEGELTTHEAQLAAELRRERRAEADWTRRV